MPIRIRCPNGHMLVCPDELAGKAGKCPHCQAKFRIPVPGGGAAAEGEGSSPSSPSLTDAPAAVSATATASAPAKAAAGRAIRGYDPDNDPQPKDDEIVFLCPEGHQLAGPATAAGEAEQCPVCKTRFIVPSPEEIAAEESSAPELLLPELLPAAEAPKGFSLEGGEPGSRSLGRLFAALWQYRTLGCPIELHLGDGRVLVPNGFAPDSSTLSHGLFTLTEPSGATTLTVIAWDRIERINVRNVYDMPRGTTIDVPHD